MEDLNSLLLQAREPLPPGLRVSDATLLIANIPRRVLRAAANEAGPAAEAAQDDFLIASEALDMTTRAYLAVTPSLEHIDPRSDASAGSEVSSVQTTGTQVPDIDALRELLPGVDDEPHPLEGFFTDADGLIARRTAVEEASGAFAAARDERNARRDQLNLAHSVRHEAKRLSRLPQIAVAVMGTILFGGLAVQVNHNTQAQARTVIASGTVKHDTARYRDLESLSSDAQTDLLDGVSILGGLIVSSGAAWFGLGDRLARPRARLAVRRAIAQVASK